MLRIKNAKWLILAVAGLAAWLAFDVWQDLPYCTIEHQDSKTIHGKKSLFNYLSLKLFPQHHELPAGEEHAMYLYAEDPGGIAQAYLYIDGQQSPLNYSIGYRTLEQEIEGVTRLGPHSYHLIVIDNHGNRSQAKAFMTILNQK